VKQGFFSKFEAVSEQDGDVLKCTMTAAEETNKEIGEKDR
jgi:hypothetical protein